MGNSRKRTFFVLTISCTNLGQQLTQQKQSGYFLIKSEKNLKTLNNF
jgi:hypothetical protein